MSKVVKNVDKDDDKSWNIAIKIEITGYQRRLINSYFGRPGMATLATCRSYILGNGFGSLDDLEFQAQQVGLPGEADYDLTRNLELDE